MNITIAIPTFKRADRLFKTLDSVNRVQAPNGTFIDILIVDNDVNRSAEKCVSIFSKESRFPITYFVENRRGLSHVRNRILGEAMNLNADYLAGIDDDEIVPPDWLIELWNGMKRYGADIVGAPVEGVLPPDIPKWAMYADVFKPYRTRQTGAVVSDIGTGNYLLDLRFIKRHNLKFSSAFNFIGGEDSDFFIRCTGHGAKVVWIREALATETIPLERIKLKWVIMRHYRIGHGMATTRPKNRSLGALRSLIKITYYLPLSAIYFALCNQKCGYRYFFRFFFHLGKLSAFYGFQPYPEYR